RSKQGQAKQPGAATDFHNAPSITDSQNFNNAITPLAHFLSREWLVPEAINPAADVEIVSNIIVGVTVLIIMNRLPPVHVALPVHPTELKRYQTLNADADSSVPFDTDYKRMALQSSG